MKTFDEQEALIEQYEPVDVLEAATKIAYVMPPATLENIDNWCNMFRVNVIKELQKPLTKDERKILREVRKLGNAFSK